MSHRVVRLAATIAALTLGANTAHAQLQNTGFESGTLGAWFNAGSCGGDPSCQLWSVGSGVGRDGSFGAFNRGNVLLRQDLPGAIAVSDITELSFWARQERSSIMAWFVQYSDLTMYDELVRPTTDWQKFDILGLSAGKSIVAVGIYGVSPADNTSFVDDWTLTTARSVPEPSMLAMLLPGVLGLALVVRRREQRS